MGSPSAGRFVPGRDVLVDIQRRIPWYWDDWKQGFNCGYRILAPSVYIFFASVLPALAFGQQLSQYTKGQLNVVHGECAQRPLLIA